MMMIIIIRERRKRETKKCANLVGVVLIVLLGICIARKVMQ